MKKSLTQNQDFMILMKSAEENKIMRGQLYYLARQNDFQRTSLISNMVTEMELKAAPKEFIEAITSLKDPLVARTVKSILEKD